MISGLSKAVHQYLAPALSLTSLFLILFSFLSPVAMLQTSVALITVTPSTALTDPGSTKSIDGPSVFLGALGSCGRKNAEGAVNCTVPVINPIYDISVLPSNAPRFLTAPTSATPAFIAISIALTGIFFFLFTFICFRAKLGGFGAYFERPSVQRATAWIGLFGFIIGLTAFLVIRMWFGKAVEDFNDAILSGGSSSPQLIANLSNGFTMVYVGYAFYAIPVVSCLAKLQVTSTKA